MLLENAKKNTASSHLIKFAMHFGTQLNSLKIESPQKTDKSSLN